MAVFERVTRQQLDVYVVLYCAFTQGEALHGYEISRKAHTTGPSTYRILDRLCEHHLVERWWEDLPPDQARPRRRYYQLNPAGAATVRAIILERRPDALAEFGTPKGHTLPGFVTRLRRVLEAAGGAR